MRKVFLLILGTFALSSCVKEAEQEVFAPKFVVEGVIEESGYPVVKLTHNIPKGYIINKEQLENLIVRWATVKVYNDTEEEILTLVRDDEVFPYFFYKGRSLKGVAGRKYQLEVKYGDVVLHSETEIPVYKPEIDSVGYRLLSEDKAQAVVFVKNIEKTAHYRLYTKLDTQRNFYTTSPRGFKATDRSEASYSVALMRNLSLLDTTAHKSRYYSVGNKVDVKVSNVSEVSYSLWTNYTQQGLQFSFLNYSSNFRGNIEGDGIGIWYGANSTVARRVLR